MTPQVVVVVILALCALWLMAFAMCAAAVLLILVVSYLRDLIPSGTNESDTYSHDDR